MCLFLLLWSTVGSTLYVRVSNKWQKSTYQKSKSTGWVYYELDEVGPIDNRLPLLLCKMKKKKTIIWGAGDRWHVPRDTYHMTSWRRWTFSQNVSFLVRTPWEIQVTCDTWHVTPDTLHMTCDTWLMTCNIWHMVGGDHSLKSLSFLALTIWELWCIEVLE